MTAPHVSPRELSRPDFPAVVHTYTDVLRVLSKANDQTSPPDELASATERVLSNVRRDAQKLRDAGVITIRADGAWTLTDKGGRWVVGQNVAAGVGLREALTGSESSTAPRWPADKIRRNPINRVITVASVEGMADAIEGAEDILIPVRLTPPDANGVRMLLAGERRWEGARLCERRGSLPEALKAGIPFTEGEMSADDGALIAVIENTARRDLSPWEDAQLLKAAADGLGITNASELARRIGRAREGDRGGLRDVQTKLRVAREATPEAIAAYEQNGSWDQLRDSVTTPKAPTIGQQVAQHGAATLSAERPREDMHSKRVWAACEALTPKQLLVLLEAADKTCRDPYRQGMGRAAICRSHVPDPTKAATHLVGNVGFGFGSGGGGPSYVIVGQSSWEWLKQKGYANLEGVVPYRLGLVRQQALGIGAEAQLRISGRYWTSWLNTGGMADEATDAHVVNGIDYGNATRANDARRALGLLPPLPSANYGSTPRVDSTPAPVVPASTVQDEDDTPEMFPVSDAPAIDVAAPVPPAAVMRDHLAALAQAREHPTNAALRLIANERRRQVEDERFTPDQDDEQNEDGEMAYAAAAYAAAAAGDPDAAMFWPGGWDPHMFKPTGETRDLVRAGALIVAELERRARMLADTTGTA